MKCESKTFSHDFAIPQKHFKGQYEVLVTLFCMIKRRKICLRGSLSYFASMSLFRHHKRYLKYKESVRDYILKYLAKREAVSEKMPVDQRWQ